MRKNREKTDLLALAFSCAIWYHKYIKKGAAMESRKLITPARVVFTLLSAAVMFTIFYLSGEDADTSSETSGVFTELILRRLIRGYESFTPERQDEIRGTISFIVRKLAHFSAYAALGFSASCAVGQRKLISAGSLITWAICIFYACTDEFHQSFVPGRSCELRDVLIDSCGALTGLLVSVLLMLIASRIISRIRSARPGRQ